VLAAAAPATLLNRFSTIDVETSAGGAGRGGQGASHGRCARSPRRCLAGAATLTFMVGGSNEAFERARPVAGDMGKDHRSCRRARYRASGEDLHNMILGASMIWFSEPSCWRKSWPRRTAAFRHCGRSRRAMLVDDELLPGAGRCRPRPRPRLSARFTAAMMLKD